MSDSGFQNRTSAEIAEEQRRESSALLPGAAPRRAAGELTEALRTRAKCLSGQSWEVPATVAMMNEAAGCIEQLTAELDQLRTAVRRLTDQIEEMKKERTHARVDGQP